MRTALTVLSLALAVAAAPALAAEEAAREALTPKEAAKALIERFKAEEEEARLAAATEAAANQESSLTGPLLKLLGDKCHAVRMAALDALAARTDKSAQKKAATSLASRFLKLEKDPLDREELLRTIEVVGVLGQPGPLKTLVGQIKNDSDAAIVEARLMAMAEIPHKDAIERLIQFLAKGRRGGLRHQRAAAVKALRHATGQRFGQDPDAWRAWWRNNEDAFDFDWMKEQRALAARDAEEKREKAEAKRAEREQRRREKGRGKGKDSGRRPEGGGEDGSDGA